MFPLHKACTVQDMFCFAALANATLGKMYTNITGAFPIWSFKKMQYIFVAYIYNLNAIIVQPMPSCTDSSFIAAFSKVFAILHACNYQPALNVMDNKYSKAVEKHIQSNKMYIQLVLPHNHRINAAEHAIAMFKEHFVATLATVDILCPLQLWDKILPQVKLTLNLLWISHCNPRVSADQELYGPFDFNKMPLVPLRTKALVYNNPATRASWAPHATYGFYVGPANNHYCCLYFYILSTWRFRFADMWQLYPAHCQVPVASEQDKTLLLVANLFEQLGQLIPTMANAKLKHLAAICQLSKIMSSQLNFPPPFPASPRVETDPPPRVAITTPPLVATTSNTITMPHTIHQLPIVHQHLT
jgi:hypothetical protein